MRYFNSLTFVSLLVFGLFTGCKDHNDHDDHEDVGGYRLVQNNVTLVSQSGTTVTGTLTVDSGSTTDPITVIFQDPEGNDLTITDADDTLGIDVTDSSIISTAVGTGTARWTFTITGNSAGSTTIRVNLLHGSHKDFESRDITVNVVSAGV